MAFVGRGIRFLERGVGAEMIENTIISILQRQGSSGIGTLHYWLAKEGFKVSQLTVGTIVDRMVLDGVVEAISLQKSTTYALAEEAKLATKNTAIASLEQAIQIKKKRRNELLRRVGEIDLDIADLQARARILEEGRVS